MDIFEAIVAARKQGEPVVMATVIESLGSAPREEGARMLIRQDGSSIGTVGGGAIEQVVVENAKKMMTATAPKLIKTQLKDVGMACGGGMSVFLEPLLPAPQLYVFGAGHIGRILSQIGKQLEFRVTVVDNREDYASAAQLPWADEVLSGPYDEVLPTLPFGPNVYSVILTHKHLHDADVLAQVIRQPFRYVGMIGSRKKIADCFKRLRDEGVSEELIEQVHAPIGLNIPANSPAEIAVAIAGELISVRNSDAGKSSACPA